MTRTFILLCWFGFVLWLVVCTLGCAGSKHVVLRASSTAQPGKQPEATVTVEYQITF